MKKGYIERSSWTVHCAGHVKGNFLQKREDESCESTLAIYKNYLSMGLQYLLVLQASRGQLPQLPVPGPLVRHEVTTIRLNPTQTEQSNRLNNTHSL